ncbi:MAG: hypothetical protein R3Y36_00670 [Spirochaetales bacterium]
MGYKSTTCKSSLGKPLTVYESEYEAKDGAEYVTFSYGKKMVYYACQKWGGFHLAPEDRLTPSKRCSCQAEDGSFKQLYETKESAEKRANILMMEKGSKKLYVYKCEYSHGWHKKYQ